MRALKSLDRVEVGSRPVFSGLKLEIYPSSTISSVDIIEFFSPCKIYFKSFKG